MGTQTRTLTADTYLVGHRVGPHQHGVRLDSFLKSRYRKRSREQIKRAIEEGAITVDRGASAHASVGRLKPSSALMPGDEVFVRSERKPESPVNFNYSILFEDEHLFVIDKPSNLPVHPSGRYFFNTLLTHLRTQGGRAPLREGQDYYLAHRLDKETSGILVLAKTKAACTHLTQQFFERTTAKRYLAIVRGCPPESFTVDRALRRAKNSIIELRMEVTDEADGQASLTEFKRRSLHGDFAVVECFPKTGRQHQIRVHLEAAGFPIVGDKLYGMPESEAISYYERKHLSAEAQARLLLPRHALHAAGIQFTHPGTELPMEFRSEFPSDLSTFLDSVSKGETPVPQWTESTADAEAEPTDGPLVHSEWQDVLENTPSLPLE